MKWVVLLAIEREVEIEAENLNIIYEKAKMQRKEGEKIVSMKLRR